MKSNVVIARVLCAAFMAVTGPGMKQARATEDFDFHISYL
jgi:hypothetical protein